MIEIIPNWHPFFVHFTVALLMLSSVLFIVGYASKKAPVILVAQWNLWIGTLITIATIIAGLYAYNTVDHTAQSHQAMTIHRNWALPTAGLYLCLAIWSFIRRFKPVTWLFVGLMFVASIGLSITGYLGAELVYRYGTGVMASSEKNIQQDHHQNQHDGHNHTH